MILNYPNKTKSLVEHFEKKTQADCGKVFIMTKLGKTLFHTDKITVKKSE
jgi:hypothetical protein